MIFENKKCMSFMIPRTVSIGLHFLHASFVRYHSTHKTLKCYFPPNLNKKRKIIVVKNAFWKIWNTYFVQCWGFFDKSPFRRIKDKLVLILERKIKAIWLAKRRRINLIFLLLYSSTIRDRAHHRGLVNKSSKQRKS